MPTSMSRMHPNYSWSSKVIGGSSTCNRSSACTVHNRPYSNIAKVQHIAPVLSSWLGVCVCVCVCVCMCVCKRTLVLGCMTVTIFGLYFQVQVDRTGQLVKCGPTPMEDAVIRNGGRVPDTVNSDSVASSDPLVQMMVGSNHIISARYMAAASMHQVKTPRSRVNKPCLISRI